jgi:hypothetical protein
MYKNTRHALAVICCGAAITACALAGKAPSAPTIHFLGRSYHLASFDQKNKPMWEFLSGTETKDDWTTRFTIIDRTDAHSRDDLKKLIAEMTADYESHGGKVLMAKAMNDIDGEYTYTVVGSDDPSKKSYELSFVKTAMGKKNAYEAVYAVRITDPDDYAARTKTFLHQHSGEVGNALGQTELPNIDRLPRTEF